MENRCSLLTRIRAGALRMRPLWQPGTSGQTPAAPAPFDFDQLARDLAHGLSRREALRRLGGDLAGALLASLGLGQRALGAPAAHSGCQEFCRSTCGIKPGHGNAYGQCISSCEQCLSGSSSVCACPPAGSAAVVCCAAGQNCCGGHCCPAGQYCCGNQCSVCPCDQTLCTGSKGINCCTLGQTCCDGACVNTASDPNHCGGCDVTCGGGKTCVNGKCSASIAIMVLGCAPCGGACTDLLSDPRNCGTCGHTCQSASGETCVGGACQTGGGSSGPTVQCAGCGDDCIDLQSDPHNCGVCGHVCPFNTTCASGGCACDRGYTLCGGACVELSSDPSHCGACGNICPQNSACVAGQCLCDQGFTPCGVGPAVCCQNGAEFCNNAGGFCITNPLPGL